MLMFQMETYRLDQASTRIRLGERVGSWSPIEGGAAFSTGSIGPQPSRPRRSIGLTVALSTKFGQAKLTSVFHPLRTLTVGLFSATSGLTTPNLERHTARKPNFYDKANW